MVNVEAVHCKNGHPLRDENDRPCPICGTNHIVFQAAGNITAHSTVHASASAFRMIEEMARNPYYIVAWVALFGLQLCLSYVLSGIPSVAATFVLTIVSTVVGYFAITRILRSVQIQ